MTARLRIAADLALPLDAVARTFAVRVTNGHRRGSVRTLMDRFSGRVERTRRCWLWRGARRNGYGALLIAGRITYAHRLAWVLATRRPLPRGRSVCHRCDVKLCVRPDHLFVGTQADNARDMWAKGRGCAPPIHRGEDHHNARLSDAQVKRLRTLARRGELRQREVAAQFGVSQSTVWRILRGVTRRTATRRHRKATA